MLITAQLNVTIEADGESACIPVFVQPESKQKCLLGMNSLPVLGFTLLCASGMPIVIKSKDELGVAHVRLIETVNLPVSKRVLLRSSWILTSWNLDVMGLMFCLNLVHKSWSL